MLVVLGAALTVLIALARGEQAVVWQSGVDGEWQQAVNWNLRRPPCADEQAIIAGATTPDATVTVTVGQSGNVSATSVHFEPGTFLDFLSGAFLGMLMTFFFVVSEFAPMHVCRNGRPTPSFAGFEHGLVRLQ